MWPKFCKSSISIREVITTSILKGFDQKNHFFDRWTWFKFNNLELALCMTLKFYTSVTRGSKLEVKKFCRLSLTFVEITGEKLVAGGGGVGLFHPHPTRKGLRNAPNDFNFYVGTNDLGSETITKWIASTTVNITASL